MTIRVRCAHCGRGLKAPDRAAGKTAPCPSCGAPIELPAAPAAEEPEPKADEYALQSPLPDKREGQPADERRPHAPVEKPPSLPAAGLRGRTLPRREPAAASGRVVPRSLYFLFVLALVPLCISLFAPADDTFDRLQRTLQSLSQKTSRSGQPETEEELSEEQFFSLLPGGKIEGAHLSHGSWAHWLYAAVSATVFLGAVWLLFERGGATLRQIVLVALLTSTFGILFLLLVQVIAGATSGIILAGGNIVILALFYVIKFIGYSYSAAMDPTNGFLASFLGFTFGVGFCEEFSKMIPVILHYRSEGSLDWRGACVWGLASGVGFGVAEGIMYSSSHYNGIATAGAYVVRFVSCVGLHATWSGAAAIMIWRRKKWFQCDWEWTDMLATLLYVLAVPMVLHGLYDTALKKDMNVVALAAALVSFAWLACIVEWTRSQESRFYARAAAGRA